MVRLISLDKNIGGVKMTATDATDNLGQEVEGLFFGGEIREGKTSIGLNDTNGGKKGKI